MHLIRIGKLTALIFAMFAAGYLNAAPKLDFLFKDAMVFSASHDTALTGTAESGDEVVVKVRDLELKAKADKDGRFKVMIPALGVVREPFAITVSDSTGEVSVKDCLSGLLILAGGQSNMEVPVKEALNPVEEAAAANYPLIREFKVVHDFNFTPQTTLKGEWTKVVPSTASKIGAVGYYTARRLHKELNGIPVGIINNSVSASPIQSWLPEEYLRSDKRFAKYFVKRFEDYRALGREGVIKRRAELCDTLFQTDSGNEGLAKGWNEGAKEDWKDIEIPNTLERVYGEASDGSYWFAREIEIPSSLAGKPMEFKATSLDDHDITYFNGVEIGRTGEETPNPFDTPRAYKIPANLVKAGKNVISIRIFDSAHAGGIFPEKIFLLANDGSEIDLKGPWKVTAEKILPARKWHPDYLPLVKINRNGATLYNAMFAPLKGVKVDAILWYQGESNAGDKLYSEVFKTLISTWRNYLDSPAAPFIFVQLASYRAKPKNAMDTGNWPMTRWAQAEALDLDNVRMVPAIDIGDEFRIHPLNKQEVGRRAALWLLQDFFAPERFKNSIALPTAVSMRITEDGKIAIKIKNGQGLKTTDGKAPRCFSVAGEYDRKTRKTPAAWANAEIKGDEIIVSIPPELPQPIKVCYAWHMNPDVNIVNDKNMPLIPFRVLLNVKK